MWKHWTIFLKSNDWSAGIVKRFAPFKLCKLKTCIASGHTCISVSKLGFMHEAPLTKAKSMAVRPELKLVVRHCRFRSRLRAKRENIRKVVWRSIGRYLRKYVCARKQGEEEEIKST